MIACRARVTTLCDSQDKWKAYRMYDYITKELPEVLRSFPELNVDKVLLVEFVVTLLKT